MAVHDELALQKGKGTSSFMIQVEQLQLYHEFHVAVKTYISAGQQRPGYPLRPANWVETRASRGVDVSNTTII